MKGLFSMALAATLLAGCATTPRPPAGGADDALAGRLTVKVDATPTSEARNVTAAFDLQGKDRKSVV